jgi:prepilin-type N-terminal cleavage/methylation domain-containing protein
MNTEYSIIHIPIMANIVPVIPKKSRSKGFTLLELLVALVIVTISFMAILPLLWNTIHVNKAVSIGAKAKDVAVQQVEQMMSLPRDVIDGPPYNISTATPSYTSTPQYFTEQGVVTTAADPAALFTRTLNISQVPGLLQDPKPVVLTSVVQYTYKGQLKSRSFSTMWSF